MYYSGICSVNSTVGTLALLVTSVVWSVVGFASWSLKTNTLTEPVLRVS